MTYYIDLLSDKMCKLIKNKGFDFISHDSVLTSYLYMKQPYKNAPMIYKRHHEMLSYLLESCPLFL